MAFIKHKYVPYDCHCGDPEWQESVKKFGGFDAEKKVFHPISALVGYSTDEMMLCNMLDHIAAGVEAGIIDEDRWPEQLFKNEAVFNSFCDELAGYEDCFRIQDYWWQALASLRGHYEEEGAVRGEEMVEELRARIDEIREDGIELAW